MKFAHVYGNWTAAQIKEAQDKLSKVFVELASKPDSTALITGLGGDPLIFSLMQPIEHIASAAIPTAATDGKRYIWNIDCILAASYLKLRFICFHEAFHAQFMHPKRRGTRDLQLWNIAIDYIVDGMIFECLLHHFKGNLDKAIAVFKEGFGNYITLDQLKAKYANPTATIPGMENWTPQPFDLDAAKHEFRIEDELDDEDIEWLKEQSKRYKYVYADPKLPDRLKLPEVLYDELLAAIPKCDACGKPGIAPPQPGKGKGSGSGDDDDGDGHGHKGKGCKECDGSGDMFGFGDLADTHLDCEEDPLVLAKRLSEAIEMARRISSIGHIPGELISELGLLSTPKMRWQDELRMTKQRCATGNQRNDYTRFKTRPMFGGMLVPHKQGYKVSFACLIDTSGSMSKDDITFGVSQLQSLDEGTSGSITCCDTQVYWEQTVKLQSCKADKLQATKIVGRGGTSLHAFINDYKEHLGKQDFLVMITDGALLEEDIAKMKDPGVPVFWLITSSAKFEAPFGKTFRLRD